MRVSNSKIAMIGLYWHPIGITNLDFHSRTGLHDFDILVVSIAHISQLAPKSAVDEATSQKWRMSIAHWNEQILDALSVGKQIIVFPSASTYSYSVQTIATSGCFIQDLFNVRVTLQDLQGSSLSIESHPKLVAFSDSLFGAITYQCHASAQALNAIGFTSKPERVVAFADNECNLIFCPAIDYDKLRSAIHSKQGTTSEADISLLISSALEDLAMASASAQVTQAPDWVLDEKLRSNKEKSIKLEIERVQLEVNKLQLIEGDLQSESNSLAKLKCLLYETGGPLESVIADALTLLGLSAGSDNAEGIVPDVHFSIDNTLYFCEAEGKDSKEIGIDKFRQLRDDIEKFEVELEENSDDKNTIIRGILFGNGQRLRRFDTRGNCFTMRLQDRAKKSNIKLISTTDLYFSLLDYLNSGDETFRQTVVSKILSDTSGVVRLPRKSRS